MIPQYIKMILIYCGKMRIIYGKEMRNFSKVMGA